MSNIENTCVIDHNGSTIWKKINLLRYFAKYFDKTESALVRLESDGEADASGSPHLFVVEPSRGVFVFELWVDYQKLLGNLNFVTAISSFVHLCFVFGLEYPKLYTF